MAQFGFQNTPETTHPPVLLSCLHFKCFGFLPVPRIQNPGTSAPLQSCFTFPNMSHISMEFSSLSSVGLCSNITTAMKSSLSLYQKLNSPLFISLSLLLCSSEVTLLYHAILYFYHLLSVLTHLEWKQDEEKV